MPTLKGNRNVAGATVAFADWMARMGSVAGRRPEVEMHWSVCD